MIIDRTSWHYHLNRMGRNDYARDDRDLCSYVRGMLKGVFVALFLVCVGVLAASAVTAPLLTLWWGIPDETDGWRFVTTLIGAAVYVIALCAIAFMCVSEGIEWMRRRFPEREVVVSKSPGPLAQWVKDRHSKVCRMLEYA